LFWFPFTPFFLFALLLVTPSLCDYQNAQYLQKDKCGHRNTLK
jgi:hypothetical protein